MPTARSHCFALASLTKHHPWLGGWLGGLLLLALAAVAPRLALLATYVGTEVFSCQILSPFWLLLGWALWPRLLLAYVWAVAFQGQLWGPYSWLLGLVLVYEYGLARYGPRGGW